MSISTLLDFELFNPYDQPDFIDELIDLPGNNQDESENLDYNALDICLGIPSSNGPIFSDFKDASNSLDTRNIIQNKKPDLSSCLIPADDTLKDIIPPKEPDKTKEEKNEDKPRMKKRMEQTMNKDERARKRRYRTTERQLYNKLRDLFPSDSTITKHQLITKAIEEVQNMRRISRFCESCENRLRR